MKRLLLIICLLIVKAGFSQSAGGTIYFFIEKTNKDVTMETLADESAVLSIDKIDTNFVTSNAMFFFDKRLYHKFSKKDVKHKVLSITRLQGSIREKKNNFLESYKFVILEKRNRGYIGYAVMRTSYTESNKTISELFLEHLKKW